MAYQARKNNTSDGNGSVKKSNATNSNEKANATSGKGSGIKDKYNKLKNGYNTVKNGYNSLKKGLNSIPGNPLQNPNMFRTTTGGIAGDNNNSGRGKGNSLPSSDGSKNDDLKQKAANGNNENENNSNGTNTNKSIRDRLRGAFSSRASKSSSSVGEKVTEEIQAIARKKLIVTVSLVVGFFVAIILVFFLLLSFVNNLLGNFGDLLGFNLISGGDIGEVNVEYVNTENTALFSRINDIKLEYLSNGIDIDGVLVVSVFHVIDENKKFFSYDSISDDDIRFVCEAMLVDGVFNEDSFKEKLITDVFPRFGFYNENTKKKMVEEIYEYIDQYKQFISTGKKDIECGTGEKCVYDIKGFYIKNKGNVSENIKVEDLYVRLMQCGSADGHDYGGTFGQPLEGEELVPFEKYILGVAYQEISESAPKEAIKAQLVAARSYILARHADMGQWRTLKKENDKWILQAASCTQDQVYCDPDKGCSSTDGQWGQIHSGMNHNNGFVKQPLSSTSQLRSLAKEVSGEVLVNSQGYIIYTDYNSSVQRDYMLLANRGLDYKQILLQIYNQGERNYRAFGIQKSSCGSNSSCGVISSGEYANWKQIEGPWIGVVISDYTGATIKDIGCFVTSVSILIAKSGVETPLGSNFNPGTFVTELKKIGGFDRAGNLTYAPITALIPGFRHVDTRYISTFSREQKLNTIKQLLNEGYYIAVEVMGNTGQHWVAIDQVVGDTVVMMDPASHATSLWNQYPWINTSRIEVFSTK